MAKDLKTNDIALRQNWHLYPNPRTKDFYFLGEYGKEDYFGCGG